MAFMQIITIYNSNSKTIHSITNSQKYSFGVMIALDNSGFIIKKLKKEIKTKQVSNFQRLVASI